MTYRGRVLEVLDGCELRCVLDLGLGVSKLVRVKLSGVDCPTAADELRREAREAAVALLWPKVGPGCEVEVGCAGWAKAEVVGSVTLASGADLGDEMVASGYAYYTRQGAAADLAIPRRLARPLHLRRNGMGEYDFR